MASVYVHVQYHGYMYSTMEHVKLLQGSTYLCTGCPQMNHKIMSDVGLMANMHTTLQQQDEVILHSILANSELNAKTRRAIQQAVEGKISSWLTVMLIADLSIRGVWQPKAMALFDVHVTESCF